MATTTKWIRRWQAEIAPTRLPGVWRMREGGHLVRARATDPTGKSIEIRKRLPNHDEARAFAWLETEKKRIRSGSASAPNQRPLFSVFAVDLKEEKVTAREIASKAGAEKWKHTLTHLISGTVGVVGFGDLPVDRITPAHVDAWKNGIAKLVEAGKYSPSTVNTWIGILKVITKAARRRYQLSCDPAEDLATFPTVEHPTFTAEEPNMLTEDETARFLAVLREEFPQHYAMACLGFATGLRPSHLRPLRRKGPTPDVLFDDGVVHVRRSVTLGAVMNKTKTGLRQQIAIPPDLVEILKWHVRTQLVTEEQKESELLFPADDGGFRSESALKKAFAIVAGLCGLKKKITQKGMRRTFNDLTRRASVESLVTRSISGHLTEQMRAHYSTVSPEEQRAAVGSVLRVIQGGRAGGDATSGDAGGDATGRSGDAVRSKRSKPA